MSKLTSELTSSSWWKDAFKRALYTAIAVAVPYLGATLVVEVPWLTVGSVAALGFITSILTSLAGLPESAGVDLPWWLAALERVGKTFAQAMLSGFVGATLLSDIEWGAVLQASLLAAFVSLLRLVLATLGGPAEKIITTAPIVDGVPVVTSLPAPAARITR